MSRRPDQHGCRPRATEALGPILEGEAHKHRDSGRAIGSECGFIGLTAYAEESSGAHGLLNVIDSVEQKRTGAHRKDRNGGPEERLRRR
jgi:hypothetical protein